MESCGSHATDRTRICHQAFGSWHRQIPRPLGFYPQKPIRRAYEQRPEAVQAWLDEQYPEIEKRAKAEGGEIHWGDETALVNTDVRGRSYAPAGKTPLPLSSVVPGRNCR